MKEEEEKWGKEKDRVKKKQIKIYDRRRNKWEDYFKLF